jgi:hypothetical protein
VALVAVVVALRVQVPLGQVPVLVAAVVAVEPLSSPGLDHIRQLPLPVSRIPCANKDCKTRCSCRSDRYEPHC